MDGVHPPHNTMPTYGWIKKGTDEDKIVKLPMPEKFKTWRFSGFYNGSLKFLYKLSINKSKKI